jgi:hypothetical protein
MVTGKILGWNTRILLDTFLPDQALGARLEAFKFSHPGFFTWPLGHLARLLYCIWSEFAFPNFILHRLQHLPATIHAEKRSDAARCPRFLFYEEAAFGEHIISPRYFTTRGVQVAQHGIIFGRIMELRRIMYKSGGVSVSLSLFPMIFI